jgi:DNA-binding LacI/PurR family transcriptional regulator
MAVGVLRAARDAGVRVPDDLAVVTTEDSPWVEYVHPQLTAVHVPMYEVGRRATEALLSLLADPGGRPRQVVLPTALVVRESSDPSLSGGDHVAAACHPMGHRVRREGRR